MKQDVATLFFHCFSLIKPQITFNASLDNLPFASLMTNYSSTIGPGIQLGKENGLTLLLDAEVYDYAFSPQKGEEHKVQWAIFANLQVISRYGRCKEF